MSDLTVNCFRSQDLRAIRSETFVEAIDFLPRLGSTNDRAIELMASSGTAYPLLVLTESQTAGRGRGANVWWSGRGALTFSIVLATDANQLPTESWPQVSLTAGLAVCEALEELLSQGVPPASLSSLPTVQLKWPNDVYLEGRKICGILVEVPPKSSGKLLVGIGINVNNSTENAPPSIQTLATSLTDATGQQFALTEVLIHVLRRLSKRLQPGEFWNADVLNGWRQRCYLSHKSIEIDNGARQVQGFCRGIDDGGALQLEVNGEIQQHLAGVIKLL